MARVLNWLARHGFAGADLSIRVSRRALGGAPSLEAPREPFRKVLTPGRPAARQLGREAMIC